jgi:hypothetical protein
MPRPVRHRYNLCEEGQLLSFAQVANSKHNARAPNVAPQVVSRRIAQYSRIFDQVVCERDALAYTPDEADIRRKRKRNLQ